MDTSAQRPKRYFERKYWRSGGRDAQGEKNAVALLGLRKDFTEAGEGRGNGKSQKHHSSEFRQQLLRT